MDFKSGIMPLHQVQKPPFTVDVPGAPKIEGETIPRRHFKAKDGLIDRPAEDVYTVWDIVRRSAREYPNHTAVGKRKLVKLHKETKKIKKIVDGETREVDKEWQYFELSPYTFITYKEYETLVLQLGSGLRKIGLNPEQKLHLFATTSTNWISTAHACATQSIPIVTAYDTLGEDGVSHSLNQTEADAMYTDPHLLKTAQGPIRKSKVKTVIVNEESIFTEGGEIEEFKKNNPDIRVITYEELRKLGEENPVEANPAKPEDLYCIMYTSGSTGMPKGASIKHEALVAAVTGLYKCVEECVSDQEVILAYLPSAHIFEMALENLVLFIGGTLGYGNARTLSDTSVRNCAGDMRELRPTVMVGVPQVWETVKKGVISKLDSSSPVLRSLFWGAFNYKSFMTKNGLPGASMLDGIVFKKVRDMTGGRLRFTMNGASGVADDTKNFLSLVLAPMLGGYGLTETCANGALGSPLQYTPNAIGPVPSSIEVKLVSIPDIGYSTDNNPPQGEIYIRGKPTLTEYYGNPEETAKALTEDGWFKTGDIGEWDSVGHLKVIDRVKNLIKMQGGEYIALEKLEAVYRGAHTVANLMVHADQAYPKPIAVIMPNEKVLLDEAQKLGIDQHDMYHHPKMVGWVLKDLQTTGRRAGLTGIEIICNVVITEEEWTPPTGLVTGTQKLNRRTIRSTFKKQIDDAFKAAN
ncbi:hypothetical protein V2G26_009019 [Clonostachys chloroleuca]|uniref:AMP-dependent synthetase/ligase domain-containing protein n=1 Tax=Clonostachys chloroleuca TaxID=1926264 RepID=A0AA35MKG3_9HYPO|nr:unnamed protein product [Clonostachys chloroleuca]